MVRDNSKSFPLTEDVSTLFNQRRQRANGFVLLFHRNSKHSLGIGPS
jgi:hypothetical protein